MAATFNRCEPAAKDQAAPRRRYHKQTYRINKRTPAEVATSFGPITLWSWLYLCTEDGEPGLHPLHVSLGIGAGVAGILRLPLSAVVLATLLTAKAGVGDEPLIIVGVVVAYVVTLVMAVLIKAPAEAAPVPGPKASQDDWTTWETEHRSHREMLWAAWATRSAARFYLYCASGPKGGGTQIRSRNLDALATRRHLSNVDVTFDDAASHDGIIRPRFAERLKALTVRPAVVQPLRHGLDGRTRIFQMSQPASDAAHESTLPPQLPIGV